MSDLPAKRRCKPCEGGIPAMQPAAAKARKATLGPRWKLVDDVRLVAELKFSNYWQTTAFVNAVAWIAHREDHHPDISFGYNSATVSYTTHAAGGLTDNDFICAEEVNKLLD